MIMCVTLTSVSSSTCTVTNLDFVIYLQIIFSKVKRRENKTSHLNFSIAECKLLVILCYAVVLGVLGITHFGVLTATQEEYIAALEAYFSCELTGIPNNCSRSSFQQYTHPSLLFSTYIIIGLIPAVNLTYVINWTSAKKMVFHYLKQPRHTNSGSLH